VRLSGKIAVLAGSGGRLGNTLAERLAAEGVSGLVVGDVSQQELDNTLKSLTPTGTAVHGERVDVRDGAAVDLLLDAALDRFGRVDIMINNAGVLSPNGRIHNLADADWQMAIEVNLLGTLNGIRSAVRAMRNSNPGSIINTASVAGLTAWPYAAPYCVTKAAVVQLTKVAAVEYARDNIRVNCVCPGVFPSNMHRDTPQEAMQALAGRHPLGFGAPSDLAGAYTYLASDEARWTTGLAMVVDGGYMLP